MTSLLAGPDRAVAHGAGDPRHRWPLVLVTALGGAVAAGSTLLVCLAAGVIGWFFTDAGSHGEPRDGLAVGALGWLMAHGSGVRVDGVAITVVPLLLTLAAVWATWRVGHRVGDLVSGHGPDADAIADGERDWTVPVGVVCFALGYVAVAQVTGVLAGSAETMPDTGRVALWSLILAGIVGGSALAVGSGRAAIWAALLPASLRAAGAAALRIVVVYLAVASIVLAASLLVDLSTAANVLSQLGMSGGEATLYLLVTATLLPNAALFSGAYLLGPGFTVGVGTLVTPTGVALGALPMFPLLAALPDDGPASSWAVYLLTVPPLVAALAVAWAQRRQPTIRWEQGALRGCTAGVLAGVLLGLLAGLAGGAVGPGRMQSVEPFTFDVLVHAITAFGIGGLFGGLAMTWWQRRAARRLSRH